MGDKGDKSENLERSEKPEKERLEFAGTAGRDQIAEYLNRLADGFRLGAVTLTAGGQSVRLESSERLRLEVEARHRPNKGSSSIALEISWKAVSPPREADEERLAIEAARPGLPSHAAASAHERS